MVVGALIFVLGLDLTVEAVWDTRNRVNRMEYITIWAIAIGMTVYVSPLLSRVVPMLTSKDGTLSSDCCLVSFWPVSSLWSRVADAERSELYSTALLPSRLSDVLDRSELSFSKSVPRLTL